MEIRPIIVLGLMYGDEGKGAMVDYLCKTDDVKLVVRFSGGHQAGHTVHATKAHKVAAPEKVKHTFSNFGCGTFSGVPTFWSKYCTFHPTGCVREYDALCAVMDPKNITLYVDPLAPVTTPYDIVYNRMTESVNQHGSVGVGFSATVERHETVKLYAMDLMHEGVWAVKMQGVENWYKHKKMAGFDKRAHEHFRNESVNMMEDFRQNVKRVRSIIKIVTEEEVIFNMESRNGRATVVFEGGQGILLDQSHGFFPNVTRSNTTSKNAMEMLERWRNRRTHSVSEYGNHAYPEIVYVMRAYQTRHGNGHMTKDRDPALKLRNVVTEANKTNKWQGEFRRGIIDIDMLKYSMECDKVHSPRAIRSLAVTCLDQIDRLNVEPALGKGEFLGAVNANNWNNCVLSRYTAQSIAKELGVGGIGQEKIYTSDSPTGMKLELVEVLDEKSI